MTPASPWTAETSTTESRLLSERTEEALRRAIAAVKPGRQVNVLGRVIESYAKRFGYHVIRDYTGHGVHSSFHSGLVIPHYDSPHHDTVIEPGMTFTIEPMLALGTHEWELWDDGWTVLTLDGSRCAQFEHTLVVTDLGRRGPHPPLTPSRAPAASARPSRGAQTAFDASARTEGVSKVVDISARVTFVRVEIHTASSAIRGADTSNVSGLVQG